MLISYNWLKKYIDLNLTPEALTEVFNNYGLPVEESSSTKAAFTGVVTAKVVSVAKHPQADSLNLCDVFDGSETLQIVCGATNVAAGQTVALAKIGAVLPGDFRIKKAKIRGIESNGMICSSSELGLSNESSGIMVLDPAMFVPGQPFEPSKPDTIYSLEITPNRPDLLCVTGVARFIASRLGLPLKYPSAEMDASAIDKNLSISSKIIIKNESAEKCPRYTARLIFGVKVCDSPEWLKQALESSGIRPINNIVDVTNYVLLELNQPLHAFDLKKLGGSRLIIRPASKGEKILALDGKQYHPSAEDLVIADEKDPAALAGIMGGENYSVGPDTTEIILESAYFQPRGVRKTSRRLGVSSDSSYRFERGIDIENCVFALNRAASLIASTAGGKISADYIDIYPEKKQAKTIALRFERVNRLLGCNFSPGQITDMASALFFEPSPGDGGSINVVVPAHRADIFEEIDIIEDIAQIHGYDNIPLTLPASVITRGKELKINMFKKMLAFSARSFGFSEVYNYSFINNRVLKEMKIPGYGTEGAIALKNPFNDEETHLKTALLYDLVKNLVTNSNNENQNIHLFENANVFYNKSGIYGQRPALAAISCGSVIERAYNGREFVSDFNYIKSVIEGLISAACVNPRITYEIDGSDGLYDFKAGIYVSGRRIGCAGALSSSIIYDNKLKTSVHMFELDVEALYGLYNGHAGYSSISRFPSVKRDLSLVVDDSVPQEKLDSIINSDFKTLIKSLTLFDLYKGSQVADGRKSLSYNIVFQSDKKTLSESEINKFMERIISRLKNEVNAELRS
jgi:phenylalanyl-tRNA synthetase beta chain